MTTNCGYDFYAELSKSLEESDENNENDECLITHLPLEENHVKLLCGHKFNYDAIFNDVYNHKKKHNFNEYVKLSNNQVRCPYCRNIQNELLPYFEGKCYSYGINTLNKLSYNLNTIYCSKILVMGKNKGNHCMNKCYMDLLCKRHYNSKK
jgi:hypothetical protein